MGAKVFASARNYGPVTPSDTTELQFNALYIGGAGNVAIKYTPDATAVVFAAVPAGTVLAVHGRQVMNTDTTATNIVWMDW